MPTRELVDRSPRLVPCQELIARPLHFVISLQVKEYLNPQLVRFRMGPTYPERGPAGRQGLVASAQGVQQRGASCVVKCQHIPAWCFEPDRRLQVGQRSRPAPPVSTPCERD